MIPSHSLRAFGSVLALLVMVCSAGAQIESVTRITQTPARFERMDFVVILKADWDDPYRADNIRLDLELTAPSGKSLTLPAYFERGSSGQSSVWHARYAPGETGDYRGQFVLTGSAGRQVSAALSFAVAPSPHRGFLHAAGPWIFRFDNGEPFRGLGENLCWESRSNDDSRYFKPLHENQRFNFDYLLGSLSANGGNFTRVWMCPWNLPLEWKKVSPDTDRYTDDPAHFNASAINRMDQFVETTEAAGVYVLLSLDSHVGLVGDGWAHSNYNVKNGGPAATPQDFFTDPRARAQYKDKLRYLVARWGYSSHLAVWELFNEVDNAMYDQKPNRIPDDVVTAWHAEMSAYLKSIDPYGHLVTTSLSHRDVAGLNRVPSLDFNQRHIYKNTGSIPVAIRRSLKQEAKPVVVGEFGYEWDWSKNFNEFAGPMERDFKQGLWLGMFSPTPILPMSWWWEFFDERKLTPYFAAVREINERMLAAGGGEFAEVDCSATGFTSFAVRCGPTTFVYIFNPAATAVSSEIQIAVPHISSVEVFDPETRVWKSGAAQTLANLTLGPGECRICVLR